MSDKEGSIEEAFKELDAVMLGPQRPKKRFRLEIVAYGHTKEEALDHADNALELIVRNNSDSIVSGGGWWIEIKEQEGFTPAEDYKKELAEYLKEKKKR